MVAAALPPFPPLWPPPPSLVVSSPWAAALYPLHGFLLPLDLPPPSKDREEEHIELKRKRGSRRCSFPSLLAEFLGETLDMDGILVPPCNYVFWRLWIIGIKGLKVGLDVGLGFNLEFSFLQNGRFNTFCSCQFSVVLVTSRK
jgi:hypothetical protein